MNNQKNFVFNIKHMLRIITFVVIVFVFCPAFSVSCYGQSLDISAMDIAFGIKMRYQSYEEQVVEAQPVLLVTLIIPIVILVALFLKDQKCNQKTKSLITAICSGIDLVVWIIFKIEVKKAAQEYGMTYSTEIIYYLNFILLIVLLVFSLLAYLGKIGLESDAASTVSGMTSQIKGQASNVMQQNFSNINIPKVSFTVSVPDQSNGLPKIGYCQFCGNALYKEDRFCVKCGARVPKDLLDQGYQEQNLTENVLPPKMDMPTDFKEEEAQPVAVKEMPSTSSLEPDIVASAEDRNEDRNAEFSSEAVKQEEENIEQVEVRKSVEEKEECKTNISKIETDLNTKEVAEKRITFKFCPYCGTELVDGAMFCVSCGRRIK